MSFIKLKNARGAGDAPEKYRNPKLFISQGAVYIVPGAERTLSQHHETTTPSHDAAVLAETAELDISRQLPASRL